MGSTAEVTPSAPVLPPPNSARPLVAILLYPEGKLVIDRLPSVSDGSLKVALTAINAALAKMLGSMPTPGKLWTPR
jgi:hypothetical protein